MILVLDPEATSERRDGEACDVAGREDVGVPDRAAQLVDDARSVAGSTPSPATTTSASSVLPEPVVTQVAPAAATVSSVSTSTPRARYSSVT